MVEVKKSTTSGIHDKKTPKIVKFTWLLAYILSLIAFLIQTRSAFIKFYIQPDISQNDRLVSAVEVPAPALTICSPVPMKAGFTNFTDFYLRIREKENISLSEREKNYLAPLMQVCAPLHVAKFKNYTQNRTERNVVKLLKESFDEENIFTTCGFK
jgi:hypothetical protein